MAARESGAPNNHLRPFIPELLPGQRLKFTLAPLLPLWEGRFKSCLVDSERYLMTVHRYIELNPVRAALVAVAEQYGLLPVQ